MSIKNNHGGKIASQMSGLGTVTPEVVEQRAREISRINGRPSEHFKEEKTGR